MAMSSFARKQSFAMILASKAQSPRCSGLLARNAVPVGELLARDIHSSSPGLNPVFRSLGDQVRASSPFMAKATSLMPTPYQVRGSSPFTATASRIIQSPHQVRGSSSLTSSASRMIQTQYKQKRIPSTSRFLHSGRQLSEVRGSSPFTIKARSAPNEDHFRMFGARMLRTFSKQQNEREMRKVRLAKFFKDSWTGKVLAMLLAPYRRYSELVNDCLKDEEYKSAGKGLQMLGRSLKIVFYALVVYFASVLKEEVDKLRGSLTDASTHRSVQTAEIKGALHQVHAEVSAEIKELRALIKESKEEKVAAALHGLQEEVSKMKSSPAESPDDDKVKK